MKLIKRQLSKGSVDYLYKSLLAISSVKNTPLKMSISRNLEIIGDLRDKIIKEKETLLHSMIIIDENGEYAIKEGYVLPKNAMGAPFEAFIYEDDYDESIALKKVKALEDIIVNVDMYAVDINKHIQVKDSEGFKRIKLLDVLEDPNNDLTPANLVIFNKYLLFDSILENI